MKGRVLKRKHVLVAFFLLAVSVFSLFASVKAEAAEMIFCPQCGQRIESGSKFCMYCGSAISYYDSAPSSDGTQASPNPTIDLYVGKKVTFGSYEQDNRTANGAEEIVWQVLAIEGKKVLLLSDQILEAVAYHNRDMSVTWEKCSLRDWLNNTFYYEAFSSADRSLICSTYLTDQRNSKNGTTDKVFALSIDEVQRYLPYNSDRATTATDYCLARLKSIKGYDGVWWWLRSPGSKGNRAAGVYADSQTNGTVDYDGAVVDHAYNGVRPAVWIDVSDLSNVTILSSSGTGSAVVTGGSKAGATPETGRTVCWKCGGDGFCAYCYGTGMRLNSRGDYVSCEFCAGHGLCSICFGLGYTD